MNSGNVSHGAHHTTSVIQSVAPAICVQPFSFSSYSQYYSFLLFIPYYTILRNQSPPRLPDLLAAVNSTALLVFVSCGSRSLLSLTLVLPLLLLLYLSLSLSLSLQPHPHHWTLSNRPICSPHNLVGFLSSPLYSFTWLIFQPKPPPWVPTFSDSLAPDPTTTSNNNLPQMIPTESREMAILPNDEALSQIANPP